MNRLCALVAACLAFPAMAALKVGDAAPATVGAGAVT